MPISIKLFLFIANRPLLGDIEPIILTIILTVSFVLLVIISLMIRYLKRKKLRNIQLAAKPYSTILESDEELVSRSYERLYRNDIAGAIEYLDKAIKIRPEKEDRYIIRGNLKIKSGDFEGAVIDFSRAITLDSKNASAYFQRGQAKKSLGLQSDADIDFASAKEMGYKPPQNRTINETN